MQKSAVFPTDVFKVLPGIQESFFPANPAAGAEWSFTLPGGYYRRLLSAVMTFTASAVVANRNLGIQVTDGNKTLMELISIQNITAGQAPDISVFGGQNPTILNSASVNVIFSLPKVWLAPSFVIRSRTLLKDVADQYSGISLFFESVDREAMTQHHQQLVALLEAQTINIQEVLQHG